MRRAYTLLLMSSLAACAGAEPVRGERPDDPGALAAPGLDVRAAAAAAVDPALLSPDDYVPGSLIVGFDKKPPPTLDLTAGPAALAKDGGPLPVGRYTLPAGIDLVAAADELRHMPGVAFVEADLVRRTTSTDDPYRRFQWHLDAIGVQAAHGLGHRGEGAVVAVIDTGVSADGRETPALLAGWDFVDDDADASDLHGHGTHVAGTIAQPTDDGVGVASVAPGARILPVRVLDADGAGSTSDVIAGIVWAVENGAQILNLSLGAPTSSAAELLAVEWATEQGALVVAASGNESASSVGYPAGYDVALAVGATDAAHQRAPYSNQGAALDLVAPGGNLAADLNGDGYGDGVLQETFGSTGWGWYFFQGTSMATPHVAGAAAVLVGMGATPAEAGALLIDSADDLGGAGWDRATGHGLLDVAAAVEAWADAGDDPAQDPSDDPSDDPADEPIEDPVEDPADEPIEDPDEGGEDTGGWGAADLDPPEVTDLEVRRRGPRVALRLRTNEPATAEICDARRAQCVTTPLGRRHGLLLETDADQLVIRVADEAGNERRLRPIRVFDRKARRR